MTATLPASIAGDSFDWNDDQQKAIDGVVRCRTGKTTVCKAQGSTYQWCFFDLARLDKDSAVVCCILVLQELRKD